MAEFTKGEWKANCLGSEGYDIRPVYKNAQECKANGLFQQICPRVWGKTWDEGKANAYLIAAAPELYQALVESRLQIEYLHEKFGETATGNAVLSRINNALAKANKKE